jgi:hypothetical protein
VRFPFTFMGLMSVAMGAWILLYELARPTADALARGIALGAGAAFLGLGVYLVGRRLVKGPQG